MSKPQVKPQPIEISPVRRRYFRLTKRAAACRSWETRIAAWAHGWILLVVAAFVLRAFVDIPWWVVAVIAGMQTVWLILLLGLNAIRWNTDFRRGECESVILRGDG